MILFVVRCSTEYMTSMLRSRAETIGVISRRSEVIRNRRGNILMAQTNGITVCVQCTCVGVCVCGCVSGDGPMIHNETYNGGGGGGSGDGAEEGEEDVVVEEEEAACSC